MANRKNTFDPNKTAEKFISRAKSTDSSVPPNVPLTQKSYYITQEQYKKIRLYAVENDTDASSVVRAAIELYFKQL
ncbi:MAG: hypothetical protein FWD34_09845 [Oscillospiraceae bacterium]|nr:hypothetical protein [Oscillospiraceae bacterium]